ncbi:Unknown protein, partial [Striga hermonthica]
RKLGFDDRLAYVSLVGLSGGLLLFWDFYVNIIQIKKKSFYIAVEFSLGLDPPQWGIFVYFSTCKQARISQWEELLEDKDHWGDSWFTIGDWNDLRTAEEKLGGIKKSSRSFLGFNSFINRMGMDELPLQGYKFTWCNLRDGEGMVEEKLDRGFASFSWTQSYQNACISNKIKSASDHSLLLLDLGQQNNKRTARFHFDERWIGMEGFQETVEAAWSQHTEGTPFFRLKEKVKNTKVALLTWSSQLKSKNQMTIEVLTKKLEILREDKAEDYWDQWNKTRNDLNEAHRLEEQYWQQKSRLRWIKEGDGNTKFFHAYTLQKMKLNAISRLITPQCNVLTSRVDIENHISEFYSDLFHTEGSWDGDSILQLIPRTISDDMNQDLLKPVSEDEIKSALFSLHPEKSPGEDEMSA